jgi:DNA polymerase bacteriophage-type
MPTTLHLDIETYATVDLAVAGVYRYVTDPTFEVLMCAFSLDRGPVHVALGEAAIRREVLPHVLDPDVLKVAHNAGFERVCFSVLADLDEGTYLDPGEWHDTMAVAGHRGYPQKLEHLAHRLGGELKDTAGTRLINLFCQPRKDGTRATAASHPQKWAEFAEYCRQDVVTLLSVDADLGELGDRERAVWLADQAINDRGVRLDIGMAQAAVLASERNRAQQRELIALLTGVDNPGSVPQMMAWAREAGVELRPGKPLTNLQRGNVEKAIERMAPDDYRRQVLELRAELALAASNKYVAALAGVNADDRIRGGFRYFGAHTGRWAGRGIQLHNLPRAAFETEAEEAAAIRTLADHGTATSTELKQLIRALLVGPFSVADYAAIEARVIAWLAGEEWALGAFRDERDIYVETARQMGAKSGIEYTRAQGKIAVLALGFGGGVSSLEAMGYNAAPLVEGERKGPDLTELGELIPLLAHETEEERAARAEREMVDIVKQWRRTNQEIVQLWRDLDEAFYSGGPVGAGRLHVEPDGTNRLLWLPSGRAIEYHDVQFNYKDKTFKNRETGETYVKRVRQASFRDPRKGHQVDTYGGRLAENATQAVARDVLADALVRLERAELRPVAHVHDEVICETDELGRMRQLMTVEPSWAPGLPVAAEGFQTARYRKG